MQLAYDAGKNSHVIVW